VKVKRRKYTPPEADLIRPAITGNIVALFDVRAHVLRKIIVPGIGNKIPHFQKGKSPKSERDML